MQRLARTITALASTAALVAMLTVVSAPPAYAACNSPDGVYVTNYGVTASGTLYWSGLKSGSYSIGLSNTRDGYQGRMVVDFFKHNVGWVDRKTWTQYDGVNGVASDVFAKSYQIDKVRFGVVYAGAYVYQLVFDVNDRCGA